MQNKERGYGGECFALCQEHMLQNQNNPIIRLAHGYVTGTGGPHLGNRFSHAWIEMVIDGETQFCMDIASKLVLPKNQYYKLGKIRDWEVYTYTFDEMMEWLNEGEVPPFELEPSAYEKKLQAEGIVDHQNRRIT